jgi:hypothetical protein
VITSLGEVVQLLQDITDDDQLIVRSVELLLRSGILRR